MDDVIAHLDDVKARVRRLPAVAAATFGLRCLARGEVVFARCALAVDGVEPSLLSSALARTWKQVQAGEPPGLGPEQEIGKQANDAEVGDQGPEWAVISTMGNACADLIDALHGGEPEYAGYTAARLIDLIDVLADEAPETPASSRLLLRNEMHRQKTELALLEELCATGDEERCVTEIRGRPLGTDVVGGAFGEAELAQ